MLFSPDKKKIGCCLSQPKCEERFRDMTWMSWEISQGSSVLVFHKSVKTELVSFENLFRNEEQKFQQLGVFWKCPLFTSLQI